MSKKKSSSSNQKRRTHLHPDKKIHLLIWNKTIHHAFVTLLIITVLILVALTYTQNLYIKQLEYKIDKKLEINNYEYEVIPIEEFANETLAMETIPGIYEYLLQNNYENIIIQKGFIQGEKEICNDEKCIRQTLRFNQRKGKYIEFIYEDLN